jgi:hypothetical protein
LHTGSFANQLTSPYLLFKKRLSKTQGIVKLNPNNELRDKSPNDTKIIPAREADVLKKSCQRYRKAPP